MTKEVFIIADIGSNHRKDLKTAIKQIGRVAECGVNAAKFQLFSEHELYGTGEKALCMPVDWLPELKKACDASGIEFMCSAFSVEGIEKVNQFVSKHKIASCEMKHVDMIEAAKKSGKQTIISNGAAHVDEVLELLNYCDSQEFKPWILECVAAYPASPYDYNLTGLPEYEDRTGRCGLSDHTTTTQLILPAIQGGASVFEVHADCVHGPKTPDSPVSLNYVGLALYVGSVREAMKRHENDLEKRPMPSEQGITTQHRRRLKITKTVIPGETLKKGLNYGIYRSKKDDAKAGPPEMWHIFEGKPCKQPKNPGDGLWVDDIK